LNLQAIIWSLFMVILKGTSSIFFSIFLFCAAYGFSMAMYEAVKKQWEKKAIIWFIVIWYSLGISVICLKILGITVPNALKYLLFCGFAMPLLLGANSIDKRKNEFK
jgi:dipeptide/tripeptide permease